MPNIVALGGGTGLPLLLRSFVALGHEPTAIVTMADDGGSSGRLRKELGIVPPGDVRNCLAALAADEERSLADVLGYRFTAGEGLEGHAIGNLLLAALSDMAGNFEEAVKILERHLKVRGRVLPSTFENVELHGLDRAGNLIKGQESLATSCIAIDEVYLTPRNPKANPEAVRAIQEADFVFISPGSLYTSIIPNLLVAGVGDAIRQSAARVIYVCNVANMRGETNGFSSIDHVHALTSHGLNKRIDQVVLASDGIDGDCDAVVHILRGEGIEPLVFELADEENPNRHHARKLLDALRQVI